MEWLKGLDEAQRAMIVGVVVQYLVQFIKWAAEKAGYEVEEAKVTKLVTAALMSGLAAFALTGYTTALWHEWLMTFLVAVTAHEVGNKLARKATNVVQSAMLYGLVIVCGLCLVLFSLPAHADGWVSKLNATVLLAPNSGPAFGVAASYPVAEHLWTDAGVKRADIGTDVFLGASTDFAIGTLLKVFDIDLGEQPDGTRIGGAYLFRESDIFFYFAQSFPLRF